MDRGTSLGMERVTSEDLYRGIVEHSGMAVFLFDRQGRRVFVNDEGVALIGKPRDQLLKGRFGDCLVEEDRERAKEAFDRCIKTGEAVKGLEVRLVVNGGEHHTTASNLTPLKDEGGQVMAVQVTVQDITGQKETREALRQANELYRSLLNATGGSVIWVRRDGSRSFVSDSSVEFSGRSKEEILKGRFGDSMVLEDRERAWKLLEETFRTGKGVRNFVSRQHVNGEVRHILANWEPILGPDGNVVEVQTTSFDVTEQERMREALRMYSSRITRAHEQERLSISRALHDQTVQTLLALASSIGNDLRKEEVSERMRARLEQVRSVLLDEVEALRRLCRGLRPAILDRMGLEEAVRWFVRQACREAGVEAIAEVNGENERLHPAVESRLFRIVQEAVTNAIRHGRPKRVKVKMERVDEQLRLEVRDDGKGFEPSESYNSLLEKGHLGLMGMMERARWLNADLSIESQPGQGTCVRLSGDIRRMEQAVA